MPRWPAVDHLPSPTNPALKLHQEYAMRTGGYDSEALVESHTLGHTTFAKMVEAYGVDGAIRDVKSCGWLSLSDLPRRPDGPCVECLEVRHA